MRTLTDFDPVAHAHSVLGRRYRLEDYYEVGREKVREYAGAVQDSHPVHRDDKAATDFGYPGLAASPTFSCLLGGVARRALSGILTGYDLTATVHTDQVLRFHRPIVVGDRLTCNLSLRSFRRAFGGDLMVIENLITDQHGEAVVTSHTSLIARSEPTVAEAGAAELLRGIVREFADSEVRLRELEDWEPAYPAPRNVRSRPLSSVAVDDELPSRTVISTLGDLVHYAGVADDPNPIHWHAGAAAMFGLGRGVIAHGVLTMAYGAGFVTSWLGDPGALRQYSVRMTRPVVLTAERPAEIEFTGRITSVDPADGTATVALTARHEGHKIFGRATALVRLS
ncbi:fused (3R)-hydroxyacyl-ACP dehydratase subunits HadA/HadB [Nocardia jejuensis]|uniref:fused (3R)-hydroxyacyl-ACP dehydratase subunits HadA/HadB n=1 Tax=Nocardia jejuensis TaxID=328049 RepID=UPI00082DE8B1|nr:fused (3R)-hydroxyacyl-ACP dehydratase subunits HadA/HadB [Nocardia jejuensis]